MTTAIYVLEVDWDGEAEAVTGTGIDADPGPDGWVRGGECAYEGPMRLRQTAGGWAATMESPAEPPEVVADCPACKAENEYEG